MVEHADVVIIGGGAMGLATAWSLAPAVGRVVLLERFEPHHVRGASHGDERMFRYLYPDRTYVELAVVAEDGWKRLEHDAGRQLFHRIGSLTHGSDVDLDQLEQVAGSCGVVTERLAAAEAAARWPGMRFGGDVLAQPTAGWLHASATLASLAELATRAGADIRYDTRVTAVEPDDAGVSIRTADATLRADVVVVTSGAWTSPVLADAGVPLPPLLTTEEHVFFFEPRRPVSEAGITTFMHFGEIETYGLPGPTGLVKVGEHHTGTVTTGDTRTFAADPERIARMERYVAGWLPGLVPRSVATATCLYTSTPTHDFVLDRVGRVVVGAGFSGHGFKFTPEIGHRLAALAL